MGIIPLLFITYTANTLSKPAKPEVQACTHPSHYIDTSHNHADVNINEKELSPARQHQLESYTFDKDDSPPSDTTGSSEQYNLQMHVFEDESVEPEPIASQTQKADITSKPNINANASFVKQAEKDSRLIKQFPFRR